MKKYSRYFLSVMCCFSNNMFAAAFSANSHSTSGLGNSYAGSVVGAHDNTSMFTNPAALSRIENSQISIDSTYLFIDVETEVNSASVSGTTPTGIDNVNGGNDALIPALYYSTNLNEDWVFGININTPFGLSTEYEASWKGRYHALESDIKTINLNPVISYKLNKQLSFGFGLQANYSDLYMTSTLPIPNEPIFSYEADDWAYGYTLGLLYSPKDRVYLGFGYRSKIEHALEGNAAITGVTSYSAISETTLPDMYTLGFSYQISDMVNIMADFKLTEWSEIQTLSIVPDNPSLASTVSLNLLLEDSWMSSLGSNIKINDDWLLRLGIAHESAAVTDAGRTPRIPTSKRNWVSFGLSYNYFESTTLNFAYVYQIFDTTKTNIAENSDALVAGLDADHDITVNIVSIGLTKNW